MDDPRDQAAAQDRSARLAALGSRADILARLTETESTPAATDAHGIVERRVIGHYRGQAVYEDAPATGARSETTVEPRIVGYYRGQPVYGD
jgi:hypothetical protein